MRNRGSTLVPLYDLCGETVQFQVTYPGRLKGWPRIALSRARKKHRRE